MKFFSNKKLQASSTTSRRGFTLVEMIVALGIFSIVAVVALGALTKIISANKKAQTLQTSITNLNFALDAMSRELRTGTSYNCVPDSTFSSGSISSLACTGRLGNTANQSSTILAFNSSRISTSGANQPCNLINVYRFNYNSTKKSFDLEKAQQTTCDNPFTYSYSPITDPNLVITDYYINVTSGIYPRATIRISGYAGTKEKEKTYFDVQTTIAARSQ
jgi:prepilin-type N-terminal cleavage/methylation domain-containing protein